MAQYDPVRYIPDHLIIKISHPEQTFAAKNAAAEHALIPVKRGAAVQFQASGASHHGREPALRRAGKFRLYERLDKSVPVERVEHHSEQVAHGIYAQISIGVKSQNVFRVP